MTDFGKRLIGRLDEATNRNKQALAKNEKARQNLSKVLPSITKSLQGNQVVMAAMREIYSSLEADGEELSTVIGELEDAKSSLEIATTLLDQANFDFANISTFANDEIWLGDHLPTIKRVVDIVNLQKLEVALDEADQHRFEDFAHAVRRSGQKREKAIK